MMMMMTMIAIYRSYVVGVFRGFATVTKSLPLPVNPHTHTPMHTDIAILCNGYGDKAHHEDQHQHDIKHNQMVRIKDRVGNRMNR